MKRRSILIMAALATVAGLASCSSDDCGCSVETGQQGNYPVDGVVRVSAGVDGMTTRACTTDNLTEFGISITNPNYATTDDPTYTYDNVQVTGSSTAGWATTKQMLWQDAAQPVSIVAYAPYNATEGTAIAANTAYSVEVKADQSSEADLNASDFLTFKNASFTPQTDLNADGKVDIELSHVLSQVKLTVTLGTEFNKPSKPTGNPISGLKVKGTIASATYDFTTAALATVSAGGTATDVAAYPAKYTAAGSKTANTTVEYECILVPQTVAAGGFSVTFTLGGKAYEWTSSDAVTLKGNTSYTLALTVGDDIVTVNSINAKAWTAGADGSLETE